MSQGQKPWSKSEEETLIKYFRFGYTDEQTASLMPGRTADAISARRGILKLEKGPKLVPKTRQPINDKLVNSLQATPEYTCRNIINNEYCGGAVPPERRRRMCYCDDCHPVLSGGFPARHI